MWIFTDTGFISIVRKPQHPGVLTVRARDRKSLELLAAKAGVEIKRSPNGDYPYRVFVGDAPFLEWFLDRGGELTYSNFKSRVAESRGAKFAHALGNVWVAMLAVEDGGSRKPLTDDELTDRLIEVEQSGAPAADQNTKTSDFGETVPDIAEDDPRIVAYLWEGFDEETGNPTWGYIPADEKEDFVVSIPFRLEELKFYGLLETPTELSDNK